MSYPGSSDEKPDLVLELRRQVAEMEQKLATIQSTVDDLRRSEDQYKKYLESQTEFFVRWKPDGTRLYVNDAYCEYFGVRRENAVGSTFFPLVGEADRVAVRNRIRAIRPNHPTIEGEHRVVRADGTEGWIWWIDRGFFDGDGILVELQSVGRDITEKKRAEQSLKDSEAMYRTLFESADDAIFLLDGDKFVSCNEATLRMFGCDNESDILLKSPVDFSPKTQPNGENSKELAEVYIRNAMEGTPQRFNWDHLRLNGSSFHAEVALNALTLKGKDRLQAIVRDITDRILAEEAVRALLEFESLLAEMSSALVNLPPAEIAPELKRWLSRLGEYAGSEMIKVWLAPSRTELNPEVFEWLAPNVHIAYADRYEPWPWHEEQILGGNDVIYRSLDDLPPAAELDKKALLREGWRSGIAVPMVLGGAVVGALSIGSTKVNDWSNVDAKQFRLIAEVIANAIDRKRSREDIERRLEIETVLAEMSTSFVKTDVGDFEATVQVWMGRIGIMLGADRFAVWVEESTGKTHIPLHIWTVPGVPVVSPRSAAEYQWIYSQILNQKTVVLNDIRGLPKHASAEIVDLERQGIKSLLMVPMIIRERVWGWVTCSSIRSVREWTDDTANWMKVVAEIISNALHRHRSERELRAAMDEIALLKERLEAENVYLREEIQATQLHGGMIGKSNVMKSVMAQVEQVAKTNSTVLILGETGTGKELLARAIHEMGGRSTKALVTVNCAAMPSTLVEGELFGREKGAYTGALTKQIGRFEAAHGGSIFLDEIGELPVDTQAKLLRVLESGQFERLGSNESVTADVRVIAATNRDLEKDVSEGKFREDLFYRLNVFPITVPPLRDRSEDIEELVWSFVAEFGERMGKRIETINKESMNALIQYSWPGNVRELRNLVERSMILATGKTLQVTLPQDSGRSSRKARTLQETERGAILDALERSGGRIRGGRGAADILGLKPTTLESRMKKLGIRRS